MRTGFFANTKRGSKAHVIKDYNGPVLCGSIFAKDMNFQWCADRVVFEYIECEKCKKIVRRLLDDHKRNLQKTKRFGLYVS